MPEESKHWASGNWRVAEGKADEFVDRWTEFLTWTREANPGFVRARLIRDANDPSHFVSFAAWRDGESLNAWSQKPEFAERVAACRALCADMQSSFYALVRAI
ncbi:antibiotic biosynthesis monooxygenase family protein [Streptomyces sp. 7N604]|uniref:antibiotic biosynthesis monooxygenase family protein n=1 Tax=Streptomyces sp. 7N604 TaxID=3457415 RepID=UPI003FD01018